MRCSRRGTSLPLLMSASAVYAYWSYVKYLLIIIVTVFVIKLALGLRRKLRAKIQDLQFCDVDLMDGIAFEHYVTQLLTGHGYINISLTELYDYGVDIVAEKDGVRWGIQVKRYSGLVKAEAVRQVVTALRIYSCDRGMVITNSTFSKVAQHLADSNDCILVDRAGLHSLAN